jgi:hypothetical protein
VGYQKPIVKRVIVKQSERIPELRGFGKRGFRLCEDAGGPLLSIMLQFVMGNRYATPEAEARCCCGACVSFTLRHTKGVIFYRPRVVIRDTTRWEEERTICIVERIWSS